MPRTSAPLTAALILATLSPLSTAAPIEVDLGYVGIRGFSNDTLGVNSYLGIPFAAPPTGNLRWYVRYPTVDINR
ncbi:hypothetical protein E4T42_07254 [Aureobasidium subglaciale]|nr:hypothetical protein E4T42_07254 [Aureobasidium subglaciale]